MTNFIQSQIRHGLTFLAGIFAYLHGKGLLTDDEAALAAEQFGGISDLIAPLIAVVLVRVIISLAGKIPALKNITSPKPGDTMVLLCVLSTAVSLTALPSCSVDHGARVTRIFNSVDTRVSTDGCALIGKVSESGTRYFIGVCLDARIVARWDRKQMDGSVVEIRYTRHADGRHDIDYRSDEDWLAVDDKSSITVGDIPSEISDGPSV